MIVGVVGLQGAVSEHLEAVREALSDSNREGEAIWVRRAEQIDEVDALIIPGGESTTISKLLEKADMFPRIIERAKDGLPIMGTCAGCILLAKEGDNDIERTGTRLLGLVDMQVQRNAFGRQKESFEASINVQDLGVFQGIFIRAPAISRVWNECRTLAEFDGRTVMVRQGNILGLAFHPELSGDSRIHGMFIDMIRQ
jgi:5'-phosphate synthase pdxT subunit